LEDAKHNVRIHVIANRKNKGNEHEYRVKEREVSEDIH
jgi:hypothetical protein